MQRRNFSSTWKLFFHPQQREIGAQLFTSSTQDCDKQFRHFVRTNSFHLLDLPEAGLRDVLVVKVKDREKVQ